ncbi:MAG: hypothetical protein LBM64_00550 [Deltaproteobacteria bacterium]|nr:hypothetical protein [Deltaproteobacteria bacterium]
MPTLKNLAVLALAARLLDRPPDGPAVLALAGRIGEQTEHGSDPANDTEAYLAPLLEQYLKALEDSSLPGVAASAEPGEPGAWLEDLAARLAGEVGGPLKKPEPG